MADERLPRRTREDLQIRAIREILRATAEAMPVGEILSVIANMTIIVFDATTSWFMLAEDGVLRTVVSRGEFAEALAGTECQLGSGRSCAAAARETPLVLQPREIDPADPVVGRLAGEVQPVVLLPMRAAARTLGLLGCAVVPEALRDISFLVTVAEQAATAIEGAELREETRTWRQRLDAVFERMAELVLIFDRDGRLALMNASAAEVLGDKGVRLGDSTGELVRKADPHGADGRPISVEEAPGARALRGERVDALEEQLAFPDGATRYFLVSAVPLRSDHRAQGAVVVWRDITERKRVEEFRNDYISLISHDLRSPLTTVMGQAQWLERLLAKQGLEQPSHAAETILTSARRMNAMIQDLVDTVRLEAGRLQLNREPTDLAALLADLASRVGTVEDRARIHIEAPEGVPFALVDRNRLERAIVNLITNALKYSASDTPVVVRLGQREGEAAIAVIDQGIGIATEEMPHLFERFFRTHAGKEAGGLGLGLYITRLIAEAHGGHVRVESEVGKGSTFYLALPISQPPIS